MHTIIHVIPSFVIIIINFAKLSCVPVVGHDEGIRRVKPVDSRPRVDAVIAHSMSRMVQVRPSGFRPHYVLGGREVQEVKRYVDAHRFPVNDGADAWVLISSSRREAFKPPHEGRHSSRRIDICSRQSRPPPSGEGQQGTAGISAGGPPE